MAFNNHKRSWRNFLIDSDFQLRYASYLVAVACGISAALGFLLWRSYREASRVASLGDPQADAAIAAAMIREDRVQIAWFALALAVVVALLLAFAIVVTHRVAGPALMLSHGCQSVAQGELVVPRPLRKGDLLVKLADEFTAMVEALRAREDSERARLEAVVERIRKGEGAEVAGVIEEMMAEKERRTKR